MEAEKFASAEGLSFRICSLRVNDECFPDQPGLSMGGRGGTTLSLVVNQPNAKLLAFEEDASGIRSFSDDTGKDLLATPFDHKAELECRLPTGISKDGHVAVVDVLTRALPGMGARELYIDGNLVFLQGTEKKTAVADDVRVEVGERGTLGEISFEVLEKEAQAYGGDPHLKASARKVYRVTIETRGPDPNSIESFRALDEEGREISASHGRGRSQTNSFVRGSFSLNIPEGVTTCRLEAVYWPKPTKISVPIKTTVGVGF